MPPLDIQSLHANYRPVDLARLNALYAPRPTQAPKKTGGRGGFATSLISELGGAGGAAGGAVGGAAIGSVVPGIGTAIGGLAGAIIGGFAGGTTGRLAENKIRDNKYNVGSALKEGGLDAAFSGLGGGFQALKGAKAVGALAKETGATKDLISKSPNVGAIENMGYNLKSAAGGYAQGARLNGDKIGFEQSKQIDNVLNKLKIPSGSPETRQRLLENQINNMNNILGDTYAKNNVKITKSEMGALKKTIGDKITTMGGGTPGATKFATEQMTRLNKVKDLQGMWDFSKELTRNSTKYAASGDAKLASQEVGARVTRDAIKNFLNTKAPGLAKQNSLYHEAADANTLLKGISTNSGGGIVGKVASLAPVKAIESKVGSGLEKVGQVSAGTGGPVTKVAQQAKFQAPPNLAGALSGLTQPPAGNSAPQDPTQPNTANFSDPTGSAASYGAAPQTTTNAAPVYGEQNLMADIQRDPKHMADYVSLYKTLSAIDSAKAKTAGGNIGKVSSQNFSNAQSGYAALQSLGQLFQNDPGVIQRSGTPGRGLPLVGGVIANKTNTTQMDALAANVADKYIRLTTGATANADEIKTLKTQMLPRPGDTPQQAQFKLQQFASLFQSILQQAQGQSNGNDLTDTLSQLQGAY